MVTLQTAGAQQAPPVPADHAKFDLFLLAGQSNMAGRGVLADADRQPAPRVLVFNAKDEWAWQGEPIHFDKPIAGAGLGFPFAKLVAAADPSATVGLIPCAFGGTSIAQWQPGQKLYEEAIRRAKLAMQKGQLKAILWHQGESDSGRQQNAEAYSANLKKVIEGFRRDLGMPNLPVIIGEVGEFTYVRKDGRPFFATVVNEQIRSMPALLDNVAVVSSQGLKDKGDSLHFSNESQKEFGRRYFEAWQKLAQTPAQVPAVR